MFKASNKELQVFANPTTLQIKNRDTNVDSGAAKNKNPLYSSSPALVRVGRLQKPKI